MPILPQAPGLYALKVVTQIEAGQPDSNGNVSYQPVTDGDPVIEFAYLQTASGPGTATIEPAAGRQRAAFTTPDSRPPAARTPQLAEAAATRRPRRSRRAAGSTTCRPTPNGRGRATGRRRLLRLRPERRVQRDVRQRALRHVPDQRRSLRLRRRPAHPGAAPALRGPQPALHPARCRSPPRAVGPAAERERQPRLAAAAADDRRQHRRDQHRACRPFVGRSCGRPAWYRPPRSRRRSSNSNAAPRSPPDPIAKPAFDAAIRAAGLHDRAGRTSARCSRSARATLATPPARARGTRRRGAGAQPVVRAPGARRPATPSTSSPGRCRPAASETLTRPPAAAGCRPSTTPATRSARSPRSRPSSPGRTRSPRCSGCSSPPRATRPSPIRWRTSSPRPPAPRRRRSAGTRYPPGPTPRPGWQAPPPRATRAADQALT